MRKIALSKLQKEIMLEFYSKVPTRVLFTKDERKKIWDKTRKKEIVELKTIEKSCPALAHQIKKSYETNQNIQSAVFSECIYAQTLANIFELPIFANCFTNKSFVPQKVSELLKSYNLVPRYAYSTKNKSRMLIQAGGCCGVDSALIVVRDLNIYTIEFKEPYAKASEPDLPKYKEDGNLLITKDFLKNYPQYGQMLSEQKSLNFFILMGNNEHNFSVESINIAISKNYVKKYADVICTEDMDGYLVMIPANQISVWAQLEGEIRPAGRNHYTVWTPEALKSQLKRSGAIFKENLITISKKNFYDVRKERGSGKISGFKISPIFFVYANDCYIQKSNVTFNINSVRQLNPTITAKMNFKKLSIGEVKGYYSL